MTDIPAAHHTGPVKSGDPGSDPVSSWDLEVYRQVVAGPGAAKLQDSRVAPLIAAARGYWHAEQAAEKICADLAGVNFRSRAGEQLRAALRMGAMVMPRYLPSSGRVWNLRTDGQDGPHRPFLIELKPAHPRTETDRASGKVRVIKYETLRPSGSTNGSIIDVHPATPRDWDDAPVALITEGTLKGDAALTALLLATGTSRADLSFPTSMPPTQRQALARLRELMGSVPVDRRVLILTVTGIANWHHNPEWAEVNLRDKRVWLTPDGDVHRNPQVWDQADQAWTYLTTRRRAQVKLLDLGAVSAPQAVPAENPALSQSDPDPDAVDSTDSETDGPDDEVGAAPAAAGPKGLDDYLGQAGGWDTLPPLLRQQLPPRPQGIRRPAGTVEVDEKRCVVREWRDADKRTGKPAGWRVNSYIAGRVVAVNDQRNASALEIRTGLIDQSAEAESSVRATVIIEVYWIDQDDDRVSHRVTGPDSLLVDNPASWHTERVGGNVPSAVKSHPSWPPDMKWLAAIKAHRPRETTRQSRWGHMGWVPTDDGHPVFVVGSQVIGADGLMPDKATPGVTPDILAKANLFGVIEPADDEHLRTALRNVVHAYDRVWTNPRHTAIALATALRPIVPLPYNTPVMCTGASGKGKSHMASLIMSFWQHAPGTWKPSLLPGSMLDTMASTQYSLSRTPIWVVDDLAPSSDDRRAKTNEALMEDLLRAVHNQANRARMMMTATDMTQRREQPPRAVIVGTAENEVSTNSAANRAVNVTFQAGSLLGQEVDAADEIRDETGEAAMVTFGAIRAMARVAGDNWELAVGLWQTRKDDLMRDGVERLGAEGSARRQMDMAADLAIGLLPLGYLAQMLGLEEIHRRVDGWIDDIFDHVFAESLRIHQNTPGRALLAAIRAALRAGAAYIEARDTPTQPPLQEGQGTVSATMLGWQAAGDGALRPGGTRIGSLVAKNDRLYVLLDPANAFKIAQRHQPDLIPYGSRQNTSWAAAWAEGLTCPDGDPWKRHQVGQHLRPVVRAYGLDAVPFQLDQIVGAAEIDRAP